MFIDDVPAFDDLMRTHGAVISGTVALHFFAPSSKWEPLALDIYLPANAYKSFVRAVVAPGSLSWTRIPPIRKRRTVDYVHQDLYSFIGGGVDEVVDPDDEYLDGDSIVAAAADDDLDSLDGYLSDEQLVGAERPVQGDVRRVGHGDEGRYSGAGDEFVMDGESVDEDLSGSDGMVFAHPDENYDTEDSVRGLSVFPEPSEDLVTDRWAQLTHYTPHRPSIVYGKGFRTMRSYRTRLDQRVNVICSPSNNPITPLRYFWSTIMGNFVIPDGALCGFPSGTLNGRGVLKVDGLTLREVATLDKYEERGFVFGGEELRRELDVWDYIFFGQRRLLAVDFRRDHKDARKDFPVFRTERGWIPDDKWEIDSIGEDTVAWLCVMRSLQ